MRFSGLRRVSSSLNRAKVALKLQFIRKSIGDRQSSLNRAKVALKCIKGLFGTSQKERLNRAKVALKFFKINL